VVCRVAHLYGRKCILRGVEGKEATIFVGMPAQTCEDDNALGMDWLFTNLTDLRGVAAGLPWEECLQKRFGICPQGILPRPGVRLETPFHCLPPAACFRCPLPKQLLLLLLPILWHAFGVHPQELQGACMEKCKTRVFSRAYSTNMQRNMNACSSRSHEGLICSSSFNKPQYLHLRMHACMHNSI